MNRSESIVEITKALCSFQSKVKFAPMDKVNPFFKSKYATLSSVVDSTRRTLTDCGLSYIQSTSAASVTTLLMHTSGEFLENETPLLLGKQDMQGVGAAVTYGRRIGLITMLGVVADDDDDGNSATPQNGGEYTPRFGKFKDKPLSQIPKPELQNYALYLKDAAAKDKKPLSKDVEEFLSEARKVFGTPQ